MNSIKTVMVAAVMVAVLYGVYVVINRSPDASPPTGVAPDWAQSAQVDWSADGTSTPPSGVGPSGAGLDGAGAASTFAPGVPEASDPRLAADGTSDRTGTATPPYGLPAPVSPPYGANAATTGPAWADVPSAAKQPWADVPPAAKQSPERPRVLGPPSAVANPPEHQGEYRDYASLMQAIRSKLDADRLAEAHLLLSRWHNDPRLSPIQARELEQLLDQVTGTVIYSRKHLLEEPYIVRSGDTLPRIAQQYGVPVGLLAKINGIGDGQQPRPGQELKVVRGPFDVVVDLTGRELTVMLGDRYAGRFPIGIGRNLRSAEGVHQVTDKTVQPASYDANQVADPSNPLGRRWIGLGEQLGIHGTNDPKDIGRDQGQGWISLGDRDIEDLYDILSIGSRVMIR